MAIAIDGYKLANTGTPSLGMTSGAPLTMAAWVNVPNVSGSKAVLSIAKASVNNVFFNMSIQGDDVRLDFKNVTARANTQVGNLSINTWHHCAVVFVSGTSRFAYLDGVASSENTASIANPTGLDTFEIGDHASSLSRPFLGSIAEACVWNGALTSSELSSLASGVSALSIKTSNITFYAPLTGDYQDRFGLNPVAPSDTVVWADDHPPISMGRPEQHRPPWGKI